MTTSALTFTYSERGDALYLRLGAGEVAETVQIEEFVYLDVDAEGRPLGVEFAAAKDFLPFLTRRGGEFAVPSRVVAEVLA